MLAMEIIIKSIPFLNLNNDNSVHSSPPHACAYVCKEEEVIALRAELLN